MLFFVFFYRQCETVVPLEDPIITECTSTLQEWGVLWKQLYVVQSSMTPLMAANCVLHPTCVYLFVRACVGGLGLEKPGCPGNNESCNLWLPGLSRKWALGNAAVKQLLFKHTQCTVPLSFSLLVYGNSQGVEVLRHDAF